MLEKAKLNPKINFLISLCITPLLHHSITPADFRGKDRHLKPLWRQLEVGSFRPGFFTLVHVLLICLTPDSSSVSITGAATERNSESVP